MPKGFFHDSVMRQSRAPTFMVPRCGACGIYKLCKSPKMPVSGKGKRKILVVAEAPGKKEDEKGIQLVGNSGKHLMGVLNQYDVDMREDCWLTNALICRPPDNRKPTDKEIDYCRPNLIKTIEDLQPQVIIPLGEIAIRSLLGYLWKDDDIGTITRWVGWQIPHQKLNAWICPTYHPSYLLREENAVTDRQFEEHLEAAVALQSRPYETVPNYDEQIQKIRDPAAAAKIIRRWIKKGGDISFDY